jgi:hypothetical protein
MADDLGYNHRDYRGTRGAIRDADPDTGTTPAPSTTVRDNGVTVDQAKETERKPDADEGVKAYGPPLSTGANDKQRRNQSTDDSQ